MALAGFSKDVRGQGILAKCQLEGLNPASNADRKTAAGSFAEVEEDDVESISQFDAECSLSHAPTEINENMAFYGFNRYTANFRK